MTSREARLYWPLVRFLPSRRELECAVLDARAWAAGYCNASPRWSSGPGGGGGYVFWRCALPSYHRGPHRARNYTWRHNGPAADITYDPAPDAGVVAQPHALDRPVAPSYLQRLRGDAYYRRQLPTHYGPRALRLDAEHWARNTLRRLM